MPRQTFGRRQPKDAVGFRGHIVILRGAQTRDLHCFPIASLSLEQRAAGRSPDRSVHVSPGVAGLFGRWNRRGPDLAVEIQHNLAAGRGRLGHDGDAAFVVFHRSLQVLHLPGRFNREGLPQRLRRQTPHRARQFGQAVAAAEPGAAVARLDHLVESSQFRLPGLAKDDGSVLSGVEFQKPVRQHRQ
ncbi:MAG: hypothetical protein DME23_13210 [Verrucomicrobia bacterium]|nr:MAG: hypothetical protein DME23_13210 [Verrucomicrobiota bacterium]